MTTDVAPFASAAQSLRDTAKWYAASVGGTAAGVFAGSSLTSLGSLSPDVAEEWERLMLAAKGAGIGLIGLAIIFAAAARVLTRGIFTLDAIVRNPPMWRWWEAREFNAIQKHLATSYRHVFKDFETFELWLKAVQAAFIGPDPDDPEVAKQRRARRKEAETYVPSMMADAAFVLVRNRFRWLIGALVVGTPIAAVGFGIFAWAANPPEPKDDVATTPAVAVAPASDATSGAAAPAP